MKILGVDPGTRFTGVGVIEAVGNRYRVLHSEVIRTDPKASIPDKLHQIFVSILKIIKTHQPDALALENIFYSKNIQSMLKIGEARACAMLAASDKGVGVIEYPPARVKQSVTGNGRASKDQVQAMVKTLLNLKKAPPADASDALAVAICHLHHHKLGQLPQSRKTTMKALLSRAVN